MKKHVVRFAKTNKDTFEYIRSGKKKIETRAGTVKYQKIQAGDMLVLSCDGEKFEKTIARVTHFKSIPDLLKKYTPREISPQVQTAQELTAMYHSFPGYKEKIAEFGILAFELE